MRDKARKSLTALPNWNVLNDGLLNKYTSTRRCNSERYPSKFKPAVYGERLWKIPPQLEAFPRQHGATGADDFIADIYSNTNAAGIELGFRY